MPTDQSTEHKLDQSTRTSIRQALKSCGVAVNDGWDNPITPLDQEIVTQETGEESTKYDVIVDISGRLILEEVMETQGLLIYFQDNIEIKIAGFQDEQLLLTLIEHSKEGE